MNSVIYYEKKGLQASRYNRRQATGTQDAKIQTNDGDKLTREKISGQIYSML